MYNGFDNYNKVGLIFTIILQGLVWPILLPQVKLVIYAKALELVLIKLSTNYDWS